MNAVKYWVLGALLVGPSLGQMQPGQPLQIVAGSALVHAQDDDVAEAEKEVREALQEKYDGINEAMQKMDAEAFAAFLAADYKSVEMDGTINERDKAVVGVGEMFAKMASIEGFKSEVGEFDLSEDGKSIVAQITTVLNGTLKEGEGDAKKITVNFKGSQTWNENAEGEWLLARSEMKVIE